jgi:hypothetical protein
MDCAAPAALWLECRFRGDGLSKSAAGAAQSIWACLPEAYCVQLTGMA